MTKEEFEALVKPGYLLEYRFGDITGYGLVVSWDDERMNIVGDGIGKYPERCWGFVDNTDWDEVTAIYGRASNRFGARFSPKERLVVWRRDKPIFIGENMVLFKDNGDIQVGCQHITYEKMIEILQRVSKYLK